MAKEHWVLEKLKEGIGHTTEANTSRYVHEVICHCLGWPFESIVPQASKRGFIDYILKHEDGMHIHVEVKPLDTNLRHEMIAKYLSGRSSLFSLGVLTNLREWQVFAAGRPVKRLTGFSAYRVHNIEINKRAHIAELAEIIGYRAMSDSVKLFELFSQNSEVLKHLLSRDEIVIKAIRKRLMEIMPDARTPNHGTVAKHMRCLVKDRKLIQLDPFLARQLKHAARSTTVAEATHRQLLKVCNASAGQRRIQALIRDVIPA